MFWSGRFTTIGLEDAADSLADFITVSPRARLFRLHLFEAIEYTRRLYPLALRRHCSDCGVETNWTMEAPVVRAASDELVFSCLSCSAGKFLVSVRRNVLDPFDAVRALERGQVAVCMATRFEFLMLGAWELWPAFGHAGASLSPRVGSEAPTRATRTVSASPRPSPVREDRR